MYTSTIARYSLLVREMTKSSYSILTRENTIYDDFARGTDDVFGVTVIVCLNCCSKFGRVRGILSLFGAKKLAAELEKRPVAANSIARDLICGADRIGETAG